MFYVQKIVTRYRYQKVTTRNVHFLQSVCDPCFIMRRSWPNVKARLKGRFIWLFSKHSSNVAQDRKYGAPSEDQTSLLTCNCSS